MKTLIRIMTVASLSLLGACHEQLDQALAESASPDAPGAGISSSDDLMPVIRSLYAVYDTASLLETQKPLPAVASPQELSRAIFDSEEPAADLFVDGWGRPLFIESHPDRGYTVASAGADGKLDRDSWTGAADSAGDDIVIRNGVAIRSPEQRIATIVLANESAPEDLRTASDSSLAARTSADLRSLASAIETHAVMNGDLPEARDVDELAALLEPDFMPEAARTDGWGTKLLVEIDRDRNTYRIIAAGSDRTFERSRWNESGMTKDYARDAVLRDGELVIGWERVESVADAWAGFMAAKTRFLEASSGGN